MSKKLTGFRIDENLKNIAYESIKIRATFKVGRSENFSEYVRNLIYEDWQRNKEKLIKKQEN